jgi:hypothetical protein
MVNANLKAIDSHGTVSQMIILNQRMLLMNRSIGTCLEKQEIMNLDNPFHRMWNFHMA